MTNPSAPTQQGITDIDEAVTDPEGLVCFAGDFSILKTLDRGILKEPPDVVPGDSYTVLVLAVGSDGVKAPMVPAALTTYCGWGLPARGFGHGAMQEFFGSYLPLPETPDSKKMSSEPPQTAANWGRPRHEIGLK